MAARRAFHRAVRRFGRDRRGNYGMMMAVLAPLLLVGAGFGVNIAQVSTVRSNLLAALDSAVTSTARDLTTGAIEEKDAAATVEAFLFANGTRTFSRADRLTLDSLVVDKTKNTVTARASVVVDVAFPLFGAANTQKVTTESAALYSDKKVEVAMMLDITGSMAGQKLKDLKAAASNAAGLLLDSNRAGNERVRIALVPYADAVNAGPLSHTVYVEADRHSPSEPPALDPYLLAAGGGGAVCGTDREGTNQFTDAGPHESMVNQDYRLQFCPAAALMPLTHDRTSLLDRIDDLVADSKGYTAGQIGVQWSWYVLSPNWGDAMEASARPQAYHDKKVAKYAILMTDGEFNTAFADVEHGASVRSQNTKSRSYAEKLCAAMKKKDIEIYTVGFKLTQSAAKTVMKNCASPDTGSIRHYFEATTGAELNDAFTEIARNIERLALIR